MCRAPFDWVEGFLPLSLDLPLAEVEKFMHSPVAVVLFMVGGLHVHVHGSGEREHFVNRLGWEMCG